MHSPSPQLSVPNTYSLRARKNVVIDRDYSPPGQPTKKKPRVQGSPTKKSPGSRRVANVPIPKNVIASISIAAGKFAVPQVEDPYFAALKSGKSVNALVEKWMKDYGESPDQAIVQFLQLIVASCGCFGKLDANMVHSMEIKDIITRLSEYFDEDSGDYPLMMTSPQWRKFRTNLGDFLTLFIIRCKNNIIYDVTLMDSLIQLLTGLSESAIRAFRHTATFAAMKISSAIVDVVVELVELKEKNAIQIQTEKDKLAQMGSNERLELLLQAKADLDSKIDELSAMTQYMFRSVFVHRYRDLVSDIRTICIAELGNWIRVYPALFLDDSYLKYIGWMLCDKLPEVRLSCVSVILPLYENVALIGRLELFTNKFKDRLATMVMDVDIEVAVKACQLLTHIYRAFPALLLPKDCVPMYEMVYCNNRQLAVAAAHFVSAKLLSPSADQMEGVEADSRQLIKDLVSFYKDGQVHNHPAYLVDSFIDFCPVLKDWQSMISILLSNEIYENDNDLVAIMSVAVKQAATGEHPPNRIVISIRRGPGAGTEKKDLRLLHEERVHISEAFIPTLPRLLAKFIADQEKVYSLLDIFLHFDLDIYSAGRHEQSLNEMMQLIERVIEQYSSEDIVKKVAEIFMLINHNLAVAQFTEISRARIIDTIASQLMHQLQQYLNQNNELEEEPTQLDQEDEAALLSNFRKIISFMATIDIPAKWNLWDLTMNLLKHASRIQIPDLTEKAVLFCFQNLVWDIKRLIHTPDVPDETLESLKKRRDQFIRMAKNIMRNEAIGVENAFMCLCDVFAIYSWKLAADFGPEHPAHSLAIKPDQDLTRCIFNFVEDNVFRQNEDDTTRNNLGQQIQLLEKRRKILVNFTKLFIYGNIAIINAAGILRYFTKFYTDYGDIFKHLLQECRKLDKVATAKAIVNALVMIFDELKMDGFGKVDQDSEDFQSLRELAKRFALSFGVDNIKNREALTMIHHDGIKYALQLDKYRKNRTPEQLQENFPFFEVLQEFSPKLHRQDKLAVLRYLDKNSPADKPIENADIWEAFQLYRSSLAKAE